MQGLEQFQEILIPAVHPYTLEAQRVGNNHLSPGMVAQVPIRVLPAMGQVASRRSSPRN
jgi:hypothetical protein